MKSDAVHVFLNPNGCSSISINKSLKGIELRQNARFQFDYGFLMGTEEIRLTRYVLVLFVDDLIDILRCGFLFLTSSKTPVEAKGVCSGNEYNVTQVRHHRQIHIHVPHSHV